MMLVFVTKLNSQKVSIDPDIKVTYNAQMKLGNDFTKQATFVLLAEPKNFYFSIDHNFLIDSGQYTSSYEIDTRKATSITFRESIFKINDEFVVATTIASNPLGYKEKATLKWVLYGETKIINGVKCQMAATNKYGRRWIAYFSSEYPFSAGPYKFYGLPGLIFELYDTRNDYHFTLTKIEKYKDKISYSVSSIRFFNKVKYFEAKNNLQFTTAAYTNMDEEMRKETQKAADKLKKMFNNPIEINPLE